MTTPSDVLPPLAITDATSAHATEAFCTSGTSPTLHLVGAGAVGQALLRRLPATSLRLIALTDSGATLHRAEGLPAAALALHKTRGAPLSRLPGAQPVQTALAVDIVPADIVVDASATDPGGAEASLRRCLTVLRRGGRLALAAKDAAARAPDALLERTGRVGINAVLGGTGLRLRRELDRLRAHCDALAAVPNASTTAVLLGIERGDTVDDALSAARRDGLLEANATLDLDGTDAALKLAVVAGALWRARIDAGTLSRQDLRDLDPELLRWRARRGRTTRLVARARRDGEVTLAFEELDRRSPLAVPADRVAYCYDVGGRERVLTGTGLGAQGTAEALLEDILDLTARDAEVRS